MGGDTPGYNEKNILEVPSDFGKVSRMQSYFPTEQVFFTSPKILTSQ